MPTPNGLTKPFALELAENIIKDTYGDTVSVTAKMKTLFKFGLRDDLGTSEATVMTLPSGYTLLSQKTQISEWYVPQPHQEYR